MRKQTMAVDQYGQSYLCLGDHPRKSLLELFCRQRAVKLYVTDKDGKNYHTGYIIGGLELTLYHVTEWLDPAD